MKYIQKISILTVLLAASGLISAQTTDTTIPMPAERVTDTDNDDDSGKWGLAGLLGLLGLLGLRHNRENHHQVRGSNTH